MLSNNKFKFPVLLIIVFFFFSLFFVLLGITFIYNNNIDVYYSVGSINIENNKFYALELDYEISKIEISNTNVVSVLEVAKKNPSSSISYGEDVVVLDFTNKKNVKSRVTFSCLEDGYSKITVYKKMFLSDKCEIYSYDIISTYDTKVINNVTFETDFNYETVNFTPAILDIEGNIIKEQSETITLKYGVGYKFGVSTQVLFPTGNLLNEKITFKTYNTNDELIESPVINKDGYLYLVAAVDGYIKGYSSVFGGIQINYVIDESSKSFVNYVTNSLSKELETAVTANDITLEKLSMIKNLYVDQNYLSINYNYYSSVLPNFECLSYQLTKDFDVEEIKFPSEIKNVSLEALNSTKDNVFISDTLFKGKNDLTITFKKSKYDMYFISKSSIFSNFNKLTLVNEGRTFFEIQFENNVVSSNSPKVVDSVNKLEIYNRGILNMIGANSCNSGYSTGGSVIRATDVYILNEEVGEIIIIGGKGKDAGERKDKPDKVSDGKKGATGYQGYEGGAGGNAIICDTIKAENSSTLSFKIIGGTGGNGGAGGKGGTGGEGGYAIHCKSADIGENVFIISGSGGNGGAGGNGGSAGDAAKWPAKAGAAGRKGDPGDIGKTPVNGIFYVINES